MYASTPNASANRNSRASPSRYRKQGCVPRALQGKSAAMCVLIMAIMPNSHMPKSTMIPASTFGNRGRKSMAIRETGVPSA